MISLHTPEFLIFSSNGFSYNCTFRRKNPSWTMTKGANFSHAKITKKEEIPEQLSTPAVPQVVTLKSSSLKFDRLQPSEQELVRINISEFDQFVAREAMLDEEYWTAAWLRAESHWENRSGERYIDSFKRKFAEQEFTAIKRRCKGECGQSCTCIVTVKKGDKNAKHTVLKSVVGTLDLNIRYLLQGESYPGEREKAPLFCSINRTPPNRYGYIANLCVAKSARRQGIASNMLSFAVKSAKDKGVKHVYVHVGINNAAAQNMYQKLGFQTVEMATSQYLEEQTYLLFLET